MLVMERCDMSLKEKGRVQVTQVFNANIHGRFPFHGVRFSQNYTTVDPKQFVFFNIETRAWTKDCARQRRPQQPRAGRQM